MTNNTLATRYLPLATLFSCFASTVLATPPAASLLPTTTKAYVATSDIHLLQQRWGQTQFARLLDAPPMKDFRDQLDGQQTAVSPLGLTWNNVTQIASGEVCVAAVRSGKEEAGFVVLIDTTGKQTEVLTLLKRFDDAHVKSGARRTTESIGGEAVVAFRFPPRASDAQPIRRYYFQLDHLFGVSNHSRVVADVIERRSGNHQDQLDQGPVFRSIMRSCTTIAGDAQVHLRWFLDPFGYNELVRIVNGDQKDETILQLRSQGFEVVEAMGGVASFGLGPRDVVYHCAIYSPGQRTQAARMLSFEPLQGFQLPNWVHADVSSVSAFHWNWSEALKGYGSWFDATYGEGLEGVFEDVLEDIRIEPDGPRVDVRKDLIQNLKGPMIVLSDKSATGSPSRNPLLYGVPIRNESTVARTVQKMFEEDQGVRRKTIQGETVWVFLDPQQDVDGQAGTDDLANLGPDLSNYAVCVAQGYLFIATDFQLIQKVLQANQATRSAADQLYQSVIENLQEQAGDTMIHWQFDRSRPILRSIYDRLRSGSAGQPDDEKEDRALNFSKLPEFDAVKEHFLPGGFLVRQVKNGWLLNGFTQGKPD